MSASSDTPALPDPHSPAPDDQAADAASTTPPALAEGPAEAAAPVEASELVESTEPDASAAPAAPAEPASASPTASPASRDLSPAACADQLKQRFPALFSGSPKPLKLRIQADINERAPQVFTKAALSAFFRRYTTSTAYLINLGKATHRFDLDGQPAGELSEEHRQLAREELTRRRQITREREQQAQAQQRALDQQAHQARQAQQAEEAQRQQEAQRERQVRLALLRDFERTTLTLANFCVLKGLKPEALTPLLDQARKELAEAPPPVPRQDDRRGPFRPRADGPTADHRDRRDGPAGPRGDRRPGARPGARQDGRPDHRPAGPGRPNRPDGKPPGPRSGS